MFNRRPAAPTRRRGDLARGPSRASRLGGRRLVQDRDGGERRAGVGRVEGAHGDGAWRIAEGVEGPDAPRLGAVCEEPGEAVVHRAAADDEPLARAAPSGRAAARAPGREGQVGSPPQCGARR